MLPYAISKNKSISKYVCYVFSAENPCNVYTFNDAVLSCFKFVE